MLILTIGNHKVTLFQVIVASLLALFSLLNIIIFQIRHKSFSIKFQLLRDRNLRKSKWWGYIVQAFYRTSLILPFILITMLFVEIATYDIKSSFIVLLNGLLILSLIYPSNNNTFYYKLLAIFVLVVSSQLIILFLGNIPIEYFYTCSASIFYSLNGILVSLSIWGRQQQYWDFSSVFGKNFQQIGEKKISLDLVNRKWGQLSAQQPQIINGGLYGWFHRNPKSYVSNILYIISVGVLVAYSILNYTVQGKFLGTIATVGILSFDFIILALSALDEKIRSISTLMLIIFFLRLCLFIFGETFWFFGYCLLYLIIGSFIGYLIIEKRYPKFIKYQKKDNINALKTPQFLLFFLTVQFGLMIIGLYFGETYKFINQDIQLYSTTFQFWVFGLGTILITLAILLYMITLRILYRKLKKIRAITTYYFGFQSITQYHVFSALTYIMIILIGIYFNIAYNSLDAIIGCAFIPPIYTTVLGMLVNWKKNDYYVLADIDQYNKRMKKKYQIQQKAIKLSKKVSQKEIGVNNKLIHKPKEDEGGSQAEKIGTSKVKPQQIIQSLNLLPQDPYQEIPNWRNPQSGVNCCNILQHITKTDKLILLNMIIFSILIVAFSAIEFIFGKSKLGIEISICLISIITQCPYYRCTKTHHQIQILELITILGGFIGSLAYWSVQWNQTVGCLAWSISLLLILFYLLGETLMKKLDAVLYALQITQILLLLVFICIIITINYSIVYLFIACGIIFYFLLAIFSVHIYKRNDNSIPSWLKYLAAVLFFIPALSVMIVGFILPQFPDLLGFQITSSSIIGICFIYGVINFYLQHINRYQKPVIISAYGLPAYRFDSEHQTLKIHEKNIIIYAGSLIGMVIYSQLIFLFFSMSIGLYTLCIFEVVAFYSIALLLTKNYRYLGSHKEEITSGLLTQTFSAIKDTYMANETKQNDDSTFYEQQQEQLLNKFENDPTDQNCDKLVHAHDRLLINIEQEQRFLFFWMILIQFRIGVKIKNNMLKEINFIKQLKAQLQQQGIVFTAIQQAGTLQQRYQKLNIERSNLLPMQTIVYQNLISSHRLSKIQQAELFQRYHQQQKQVNQKRQQQLNKKLMDMDQNQNAQMISKFKILLKNLKKNIFVDQQFKADQSVLGSLGSRVERWQRPNAKCKLIQDQLLKTAKQGAIGDCYLISAFGVLGEKNIRMAFGMQYEQNNQKKNQQWENKKGAYMVRFKKFSRQIYVIVDDYLPVDEKGDWVFGSSQDPTEFWPNILEKAYAKLYGGYFNIVSGKSHLVLSQFTGGFPTQIILKQYQKNLNSIWKKLLNAYKNNYLLAAGSPSNPQGDSAISRRGIVQGHAYGIVQIKQVQDNKLIKLKNPHGTRGVEWTGDWSDESLQMTKRMMGLLGHEKKSDGLFWMSIEDFVFQFKSLYLCRVFDKGWKNITHEGRWTQENSYGAPNMANIQKNPQYGIKVNKKCTLFISLTQQSQNSLKGNNYITFRVQKNDGKRMISKDITTTKLCGPSLKVVNSITISSEIQIDLQSYPYILTLMVCTSTKGDQGSYTIQLYCNDQSFETIDDLEFDRQV